MATVFGLDINEINTNNLIRDDHIETIYGVLSGDPTYSSPDHVIDFTGSLMAGKDNELASSVNFGFAFGENNRVGGESSFVVGKDGRSFAEGQFVLSGGNIIKRGDSQKYETTRSFQTASGGNSTSTIIPIQDNVISSIEVRLTGVEKDVISTSSLISAQYDLVFVNSRMDPDSSERVGKVLFIDRNWLANDNKNNPINDSANGIEVEFNVTSSHELELNVIDNRSSGNVIRWSIHIDALETFAGKDITSFSGRGYESGYISDSGKSGYKNPIQGCFPPHSEVLVNNEGEPVFARKIKNVEAGDSLLAFRPPQSSFEDYRTYEGSTTGIQEMKQGSAVVEEVFYGFKDSIYEINDGLEVSASQPIFVFDPKENCTKFVKVGSLKNDMRLLNNEKKFVNVRSIIKKEEPREVVSLDVEELDVFFVKGILFHNKH